MKAPSANSTSAFRPATRQDWPAIRVLLRSANLPLDGAEAHLATFLVATADETVVGCVGIERHADAALLRSCAVADDCRRQGLGHELVRRAIALARSLGIRELVLLTTTAETYFPRFGFAPAARDAVSDSLKSSPEFSGACPASARVMQLTLAD
ncbi:MAG: arsenic resistance N-acetyltransferase ArsN2 [Betaproteobacteria bacterium]